MFFIGLVMVGVASGFLLNSIAWAVLIIGAGLLTASMLDYLNNTNRG